MLLDTIKTKANRSLGFIKCAKKYLPSDVLKKMYRGIVEPHLSYCCFVWGCGNESKISALQKIQNRAARIVTNSPYGASTLVKKETATLIYKSLNSLAPEYFTKLFIKCSDDSEWFLSSSDTDVRIPLL